jgi:hypothetical protein
MPLLEYNVSANPHLFQNTRLILKAAVLDWGDEVLPNYIQNFKDGFDAIVYVPLYPSELPTGYSSECRMADVTYNTSSFPSLIRTLSFLIHVGTRRPIVLLGYKERDAAERTLWALAGEIGLSFEIVGERAGAGGAPVEVWIGYIKPP